MFVKSAPGTKTPKEGKPREYILDTEPGEDVPESAYYHRLLTDNSLVPATGTAVEPNMGGN